MIKKISTLAICDFVLALIIYARVNLKNALLSEITTKTSQETANQVFTNSNFVVVITLALVGAVISVMVLSKTEGILQLLMDVLFIGVVGVILALWWKVLAITGWGYFCSYQELMTYVGSFMVGACILKLITYFFRKRI